VVEQQVDEKVIAADFDRHLPPDIGEARAEFQQEAGDVLGDGGFDGALVGFLADAEEVQAIGGL
jgi:hypothetical protein